MGQADVGSYFGRVTLVMSLHSSEPVTLVIVTVPPTLV